MYVPNYVPSIIEIPGSVAEKSWRDKLAFLRLATMWFLILAALVALCALAVPYDQNLFPNTVVLAAGGCLFLNLVRTFARDSQWERGPSLVLTPFVILALGLTLGGLGRMGFPIWALASSCLFFGLYTYLCGRDFSFIGQFVLATGATIFFNSLIVVFFKLGSKIGIEALFVAIFANLYFSYDLASIMSRRRRGEELHAGIDFLRDMFNFVGFSIRCRRHWKRHNIFVLPK